MSHCCLHRKLHLRGGGGRTHRTQRGGASGAHPRVSLTTHPRPSPVATGTLMLWWTDPLGRSPAGVSRQQGSSLGREQGQPNLDWRLLIRCRLMGLFVPLKVEGPPDRGSVEPVSLWSPRAVWSLAVCPLRLPWGAALPMGGVKPLSLEPSWWSAVPGSSRAKSESMQRSLLRAKILWGRSSRDASESLRRRLYLARRSMPAERSKVLHTRTSKSRRFRD